MIAFSFLVLSGSGKMCVSCFALCPLPLRLGFFVTRAFRHPLAKQQPVKFCVEKWRSRALSLVLPLFVRSRSLSLSIAGAQSVEKT